jgi:hypothetical protein
VKWPNKEYFVPPSALKVSINITGVELPYEVERQLGVQRVRRYNICPEFLRLMFITGRKMEAIDGIPSDAKVVRAGYDEAKDVFYMYIEHKSFDPVDLNQLAPDAAVQFHTEYP